MEEFRQIGEVVGSLNAVMVFQDDIQINQKQCCLLVDMINHAYKTVAEEMKENLRFEEKNTKWKVLENPLKQLLRVFREGDFYVRKSLDVKESWWAKAIYMYQNTDCVEFLLHDLLCIFPVVIEAIEMAGELSGWDQEEMQKKRAMYSLKYKKECKDHKIFHWKFGKQYLVQQHFCNRFQSVLFEDRQILINKLQEKKKTNNSGSATTTLRKQEQQLADLLLRNLEDDSSRRVDHKLLPSSILVGSKDYQVRRRLGNRGTFKEIQWLGESFALKHLFWDIDQRNLSQISQDLALSHPNIMHVFCGFTDDERKECFLVMELMSRDLSSYIKEICGPKKRFPFSLPVAVDLMLQIARGMEYLHSNNIYHGELNPSKILVKPRNISSDGYLHAKVSGLGLSSVNNSLKQRTQPNQNGQLPFIWYAPEVLAEQEQSGNADQSKYTEKADVYSFGMICFQLLTGKVPFEDAHLQGDKMSRNIRAGERPLFPFYAPKHLTNLTKKCWNNDPSQRPSFSSICRILRYIKGLLVMNPEQSQTDSPASLVDYSDIETTIQRSCPSWGSSNVTPISQIPYQMFVYRATEKERLNPSLRETSESGSDASVCGDESAPIDDPLPTPSISPEVTNKRISIPKRSADMKTTKQLGEFLSPKSLCTYKKT